MIWTVISAIYYLFIHNLIIDYLKWFAEHLDFAFFVGLFWGFFILDIWTAFIDAMLIKRFANDHDVIVRYEDLKALMQTHLMESNEKQHFFGQIIMKGMDLERSLESCAGAMEKKTQN